MGILGWPAYYETLGDAIEDSKKIIAKIETNKYSNKDVIQLAKANAAIIEFTL